MIHDAVPLLTRLYERVRAHPDKAAFLDGDKATDYASLWAEAMQWRDALRGHIDAGDRVAVLMDNGAGCAAAGYGIWAAGGVWVGLNTSLKTDDLLWQIRHCSARVLIAGDKFAGVAQAAKAVQDAREPQAADTQGLLTWLHGQGPVLRDPAGAALEAMADQPNAKEDAGPTDPTQPAAIIFTSGTTGRPKGVVLTHAALAANAHAIQRSLPIRPDDITLCLLPFFYAYGFSVLHTHLSMGATLVLEHSLMYPQKVLQRMTDTRATAFYGVPSSYYLLLERGHLARADLKALRYCAQAGGAMDPARIEEVCAALPQAAFHVMYGQTEACSRLTTLPADWRTRKRGSVGIALPGVTLSIQDEAGALLPTGAIGEVCAQGPNLMQGYWQAPEDTARTLQGAWLHTGDLGYLDEDGCLFLTGRSREQIKTGAHRVSPWEIEQLIQSVPGVREAAVVGEPDHLLGEIIHAYVIADPASDPSPDAASSASDMLRRAIMQTCKLQLAAYKMPKHLSFVSAFPRTGSGKVQKHLLATHHPASAASAPSSQESSLPSQTTPPGPASSNHDA